MVDAKKLGATRQDLIESFTLQEVISKKKAVPLFEISEQEREAFVSAYPYTIVRALAVPHLYIFEPGQGL